MIQAQTFLSAADNSGAKLLQCIKVLGGTNRTVASIGDIIVVSVKEAIPKAKVKKGQGTVGAVLMDDALYDDIQTLVRDLKRNPWKFLWKD